MRIIISIFITSFISLLLQAQENMSLEACIEYAKNHTVLSKIAESNHEIARSEWELYQIDRLPQIRLNGSLPNYSSAFREVIQPDGNVLFSPVRNHNAYIGLAITQEVALTGGQLMANIDLQRYDDLALKQHQYFAQPFRLSYYQPFFQPNQRKWDQRIFPLKRNLAKQQQQQSMREIELTSLDYFFALLIAQNDLAIAKEQLAVSEQLYLIAQRRHDLGHLSKGDLLQLEVQKLSVEQTIEGLLQREQAANMRLALFLNAKSTSDIRLETPNVPPDFDLSLEEVQRRRNETDPRLSNLDIATLEAQKQQALVKASSGWQAGLMASVGWSQSAEEFNEALNQSKIQQSIELQFSIPLVDWGVQKERRKQAALALEIIEQKRKWTQLESNNELAIEYDNYLQLKSALENALKIEALTKERYEIVKTQFLKEKISITELNIATSEMENTRSEYLQLLQRIWRSYLILRNV